MNTAALDSFVRTSAFPLDPFQVEACRALADGHGVLVCAPTGAGKTVVGEFAVHLALDAGTKCFYTTPIKALSNQKFADLGERFGVGNVGLLTGDQSIRPDAPVIVMTTEVLRNMLYANSTALIGLSHVVMDEVHFLADRFRGGVWEEVILYLPDDVRLVSLSATVSNAEEFGEWMRTVRGDTAVVVDDVRPIPLMQQMLVGSRLYDLFDPHANAGGSRGPIVDPDLVRQVKRRESIDAPRGRRSTFRPPSRPDVIRILDRDGLLPAITFVFSRAGCDAAVTQCLRSDLVLTTEDEARRIGEIVDQHIGDELPRQDLEVLGYRQWRAALERGIAAHHAGMLPAFRHTVEHLFVLGLVRAVFATETLALGINMPARTVVLERLVKYNGETHADLTPGEYTQLTGRAGRRGIDVEGHAVVVWQPGVSPVEVAGLASTRTFPLRSSFRPSYNMAVNLIGSVGIDRARALLEQSFAQFQADRSVVELRRTIERNTATLDGLRAELGDEDGEVLEYLGLREELSHAEKKHQSELRAGRRRDAVAALRTLRRGDVVAVPSGRHRGLAVVVDPDHDVDDPRPRVVTASAWSGLLGASDFHGPVAVVGTVRMPRHHDPRTARGRRDIASSLRSSGLVPPRKAKHGKRSRDTGEIDALRRRLRRHPMHDAPGIERLARTGERLHRLERETNQLREKVTHKTHSLVRTFDRIVALLTERGYLTAGDDPEVTAPGALLARIYCESDLLVAECLRAHAWDDLDPEALAAVASTVLYESRVDDGGGAVWSVTSSPLREAVARTDRLASRLRSDEARHRLPTTRIPDQGFAEAVRTWAAGGSLADTLALTDVGGRELPPGDFVRWCRQIVDLLEQLRSVAPDDADAARAREAARAVRRGVVAADAL